MLGLIVILISSWITLRLTLGQGLNSIGITPNPKRIKQFVIGLVFALILSLLIILIDTMAKSIQWSFSSSTDFFGFIQVSYYHFISALTEDLLFRGALLYILLQKTNDSLGTLLSALAFGLYHWVSYGVVGDFIPMLYVLVVTGLTGYIWAVAFVKSRSIAMGLGLHFGWNIILQMFSRGPLGEFCFIPITEVGLSEPLSSIYTIIIGLIPPIITLLFINWYFRESV